MIIKGQVIDLESGEGLPSASIAILGSAEGTMADSQGRFSLTSPLLDNYSQQVTVSYVNYAPTTLYGFQCTGEIPLSRSGSLLDAVVITAKILKKKQSIIYVLLTALIITSLFYLTMRGLKYFKQLP